MCFIEYVLDLDNVVIDDLYCTFIHAILLMLINNEKIFFQQKIFSFFKISFISIVLRTILKEYLNSIFTRNFIFEQSKQIK